MKKCSTLSGIHELRIETTSYFKAKSLILKKGKNITWILLNLVNTKKAKEEDKKYKWSCYLYVTSTNILVYFIPFSFFSPLCIFNLHS